MKAEFQGSLRIIIPSLILVILIAVVGTSGAKPNGQNGALECRTQNKIGDVAISADDQFVVASNWKNTIDDPEPWRARMWRTDTGEVVQDFPNDNPNSTYASSVAISPDNRFLLTGDSTQAELWDIQSGTRLFIFPRELSLIAHAGTSVMFTPDSQYAITGGSDGASVWDVETGLKVRSFPGVMDEQLNQRVQLSADGKYIITSDIDKRESYLFELETGVLVHTFPGDAVDTAAIPSPDSKYVAAYDVINGMRLYDLETGRLLHMLDSGSELFDPADWSFSADSRYLFATGGIPAIWDVESGQIVHDYPGAGMSMPYGILPDSRHLVMANGFRSTSGELNTGIWDIATGELRQSFYLEVTTQAELQDWTRSSSISTFAFASDSQRVLVGTFDGQVELWDLWAGTKIREFC